MSNRLSRRRLLQIGGAGGAIALAGCTGGTNGDDHDNDDQDDTGDDHDQDDAGDDQDDTGDDELVGDGRYEIWALDQGTHMAYVYEPAEGEPDTFVEVASIDFAQHEAEVPHMISFSSDYSYAAVACTAGAKTVVVDTETKEVVEVIETGSGSHMAGFSPDDEYIVVDVIDEGAIKRIDADLDEENFELVDEIVIADSDAAADHGGDFDGRNPICHSYTHDGYSYHTLGPSYNNAGLVIVDHDDFSIEKLFHGDDDDVPTNCGTMPHPTDSKFYLTAGLPSDPDEGVEGVGEYYIFDTDEHELIDSGSTEGVDAHGFWFTPDGEELWVLNRETDDGIILDPETDEVIDEIEDYGPAPDIMWAAPDGEYMFVSLRGPDPVSGDPHAATGETPGFSVLDVESREIVTLVEPDPIDEYSDEEIDDGGVGTPDFHGLGVRPLEEFETEIPTSPPF